MATAHHGEDGDSEAIKRFMDHVDGVAVREFPHGRAGADDDGAFTYAIATDGPHRMIRIQFPTPTTWIGLDVETAEALIQQLEVRVMELKCGSVSGV